MTSNHDKRCEENKTGGWHGEDGTGRMAQGGWHREGWHREDGTGRDGTGRMARGGMTTSTKMVREGRSEVSLHLGNERSKGQG